MTVGVTNREAICFFFFWFLYFSLSESDRASKSAALNIINIKFSRVDLTANDRLLKKQSQPREKKTGVSQTSQWLVYELSTFLNNSQWSEPSSPANGDSSMTYISKRDHQCEDAGYLFIVILEACHWVRFSLKHTRGCWHFPRRSCAGIRWWASQKEESLFIWDIIFFGSRNVSQLHHHTLAF